MLDVLTDGFRAARDQFRGKATLNADNIDTALEAIRKSLLEADVEYGVAKNFLARIKAEAIGQTVQTRAGGMRVSPGDHFVRICQEQLQALMGPADSTLHWATNRPTVLMMVGLQGSGKTTTTGKLTKYLADKLGRKPLLAAADIYRPAAAEQLKILGAKVGAPVFHLPDTSPVTICERAVAKAFELKCDTVIFDTAGRLTIDEALMQELADIKTATRPDNILLVCDAMMGQDAVTTAKAFDARLGLSGVIITKLDGDARGGAALSIREVTGRPIKFLGMGEDLERLEEFRPEGLASRILGMGDVVGLMQDFERVASDDRADEAMRMLKGQFTLRDFYQQLTMIQQLGPLKETLAKLPLGGMFPKDIQVDDRELLKIKAMIDSMTEGERLDPNVFNESRVRRVARGSGRPGKEVAELLKKFVAMRKMMGSFGKNLGLLGKIPGVNQLAQMNQLRKMATAGGGGMGGLAQMASEMGMGGMGGLGGLGNLLGGAAAPGMKRPVDRDKQRKLRKDAKKARKKNRKR